MSVHDFSQGVRIEPDPTGDLARGWSAEAADPLWFLGKQWQMGEHAGEDLSAPVRFDVSTVVETLLPVGSDASLQDPQKVPAEAIIEGRVRNWIREKLTYRAVFRTKRHSVDFLDHRGGDVDWWAADLTQSREPSAAQVVTTARIPRRLSYPGAPHPRWWQLENRDVDLGGFAPDRTQLATLLLIELVTTHADDWFSVPISAAAGSIVRVMGMTATDAFGDTREVVSPNDWTVFHHTGSDGRTELAVFPVTTAPLIGPVQERVEFGLDPDADLVWAVLRRTAADGELSDDELEENPTSQPDLGMPSAEAFYRYRPAMGVRRGWWPYLPATDTNGRRWVRARLHPELLAELSPKARQSMNAIPTDLLGSPQGHHLDADVVPETGVMVEKRWALARATDGSPVLWLETRRLPMREGPVAGLRFDVAVRQPADS